jgi:DNA-binding CsgD family transcriptional regulator
LKTVEAHRAKIMRKIRVESAAGLVRYAIRNGLVEA